jgi:uncharacterized protein involved in exopolysaccharide biosynthesis
MRWPHRFRQQSQQQQQQQQQQQKQQQQQTETPGANATPTSVLTEPYTQLLPIPPPALTTDAISNNEAAAAGRQGITRGSNEILEVVFDLLKLANELEESYGGQMEAASKVCF